MRVRSKLTVGHFLTVRRLHGRRLITPIVTLRYLVAMVVEVLSGRVGASAPVEVALSIAGIDRGCVVLGLQASVLTTRTARATGVRASWLGSRRRRREREPLVDEGCPGALSASR